ACFGCVTPKIVSSLPRFGIRGAPWRTRNPFSPSIFPSAPARGLATVLLHGSVGGLRPMIKLLRPRILASLATSAMLVGVACSGTDVASRGENLDREEKVGSVAVSLDVGGGIIVNSASYTVTGPGSFSRTGSIDLSHSTMLSTIIAGLPAGIGYT